MIQIGFNFLRTPDLNGQFFLVIFPKLSKKFRTVYFVVVKKDLTATLVFVLESSNNVNTKTFLKQTTF